MLPKGCIYQTPTVDKKHYSGTAHSCSQWSSCQSITGAGSGPQSEILLSLMTEKPSYTCSSAQEKKAADNKEAKISISRVPLHSTRTDSFALTDLSVSLSCLLGLLIYFYSP